MELAQWVAVFSAISTTAAARERSRWAVFSGALISCTLLLFVAFWSYSSRPQSPICIGVTILGLLVTAVWAFIQQRLRLESEYWHRALRSIEGQFAGAEFYRGLHKLQLGEQVCVPAASWVCGEWNPAAAKLPWQTRGIADHAARWFSILFVLAFAALLTVCLVVE